MWLLYAFLAALSESVKDATSKYVATRADVWVIAFYQRVFASIFLWSLVLYVAQAIQLKDGFWPAVAITLVLNVAASWLFLASLRHAPMSLTLPIQKLSPVFLLITAPIITHEVPKMMGCLGVIITAIGIYIVNRERQTMSLLDPFRMIWSNLGIRYMLIVVILWSISAPFDKIATLASTPIIAAAIVNTGLAVLFLPLAIRYGDLSIVRISKMSAIFVLLGAMTSFGLVCQFTSISLAPVPYVITIKRTSTFWSILWAKLFFKEERVAGRLFGALVAFVGMVLVIFSM